jgi:uncharacterized protein YjbK
MSNNENELKLLLKKEDFEELLLLGSNKVTNYKEQTNYYFDTDQFTLSESGITLRIRKENEKNLLCLKIKNKKNSDTYISSMEYEVEVPTSVLSDCKQAPQKIIDYLPYDAQSLLLKILNGQQIKFIGSIKNKRHCLKLFNNYIFELDHSFFPNGTESYEVEVEGIKNDKDSLYIMDFFNRKGFKYNLNTKSKYKRFVESLSLQNI